MKQPQTSRGSSFYVGLMEGMLSLSLSLSSTICYDLGVFSSSVHGVFNNTKHLATIVSTIKDYIITNKATQVGYQT